MIIGTDAEPFTRIKSWLGSRTNYQTTNLSCFLTNIAECLALGAPGPYISYFFDLISI